MAHRIDLSSRSLLSVADLASLMGVSESRIRQLVRAKEIPGVVRVGEGNMVRFDKSDALGWLASRGTAGTTPTS